MSTKGNKIVTTVYLPKKLVLKLKVFAASLNQSMSATMQHALEDHMHTKRPHAVKEG